MASKRMGFKIRFNMLDLTKKFSVNQLILENIVYELDYDEEYSEILLELSICFQQFLYDGITVDTEMQFRLFKEDEIIHEKILSDGYHFKPEDDLEGYTIYIQNVHNFVDLSFLKIERKDGHEIIKAELFFDFESARTDYPNQTLSIEHKLIPK